MAVAILDPNDQIPKPLQPASKDQPIQSRLLTLPAELRTQILSYLLIQDLPSRSRTSRKPVTANTSGPPQRICARVLSTCKLIHQEGTAMLYGQNVFSAHASLLTGLPRFCVRIHPKRETLPPVTQARMRALIRRWIVLVRLDTDAPFTREQAARAFGGVAELEVEVFQSSYGTCDFTRLALFEDVRGVGRAVVAGSVGDGMYARHLARVMESPPGTVWPAYEERYVGGDQAWDAWTQGNR